MRSFIFAVLVFQGSLSFARGSDPDFLNLGRVRNFFGLELTRNEPVIHTEGQLVGARVTYHLSYRHILSEDWLMGVGVNFKSFDEPQYGRTLNFFTLSHEALNLTRLNHPLYLFFGTKLLYMVPTARPGFPLSRIADYETEVGAGLSLGLIHFISSSSLISVRFDRWRGTKTNRFHGVEFATGIHMAIK